MYVVRVNTHWSKKPEKKKAMAALLPLHQRQENQHLAGQSGSGAPGKLATWSNSSKTHSNNRFNMTSRHSTAPFARTLPVITDLPLLSEGGDGPHQEVCLEGRNGFGINPSSGHDRPDLCELTDMAPSELNSSSRSNQKYVTTGSSPMMSLLWAHQLHVENKALESRLKDIEKTASISQEKALSQEDYSHKEQEMETRLESFKAEVAKEMKMVENREIKVVQNLEQQFMTLKADLQESRKEQALAMQTSLSRLQKQVEEQSKSLIANASSTNRGGQKRKRLDEDQDKTTVQSAENGQWDAALEALRQEVSALKNEMATVAKNVTDSRSPHDAFDCGPVVASTQAPDNDVHPPQEQNPTTTSSLLEPQPPIRPRAVTPIHRKRPRQLSSLTGTPTASQASSSLDQDGKSGPFGQVINNQTTFEEDSAITHPSSCMKLSPWKKNPQISRGNQLPDCPSVIRARESPKNAGVTDDMDNELNCKQWDGDRIGGLASPAITPPESNKAKAKEVSSRLNTHTNRRGMREGPYISAFLNFSANIRRQKTEAKGMEIIEPPATRDQED